jgi:hypothetical protein
MREEPPLGRQEVQTSRNFSYPGGGNYERTRTT